MSDEKMVIGHESHDTGEKEISDRDEMIGDALIRSMASMGLSTMEILGILQSAAAKCCVAFSPTIESAHENVDAGAKSSNDYVNDAWPHKAHLLGRLNMEMEKTN